MSWSLSNVVLSSLLLSLPVPGQADFKADRVIVTKSERTLTLLRDGAPLRTYPVALGARPTGHKQREGDKRTPEGLYSIDARNPDSAYHLSLHISYPNDEDRRRATANGVEPGGQIMIHGIGNSLARMKRLHPLINWTDGCVAVTDREMEEIWRLVEVGTPIEIQP